MYDKRSDICRFEPRIHKTQKTMSEIESPNKNPEDLKFWYLKKHKLFRNLSFSEINQLCIIKRFNKSKRSEIIELPQTDKERIYFLKKGTIKLIQITEDGEEKLIDVLQKGDIFGELGLQNEGESTEFFKVVSTEALICTFYRENLEELMRKKPEFAIDYIKFIGLNIKRLKNSYSNIFFKDARMRLLLLFKNIISKEGGEDKVFEIPNYFTQKDLAQLICTTRQTVISLLKEFESEGLIEYSQKCIRIKDVPRLKRLVAECNQ